MEERPEYQALSDEEVARRVSAGDRDALAALYRRHVDALYDYLARTLKDPGAAHDAVQTTYVKAWASLTSRPRAFKSVRAWLFTIARNVAIDEIRRQRRVIPDDISDREFVAIEPSRLAAPDAVAQDRELVELVWRSASALSPDDYALLHLWVREGLSIDELAEVSGVRKGAMYTRLSRLRDALDESVSSVLLARHGRRNCSALDATLSSLGADAPLSSVRRQVRRHVGRCERCQDERRRLTAPTALFGALTPLSLSLATRDALWQRIQAATEATPSDARPKARTKVRASLLAAGAVALAAIIVGALVARSPEGASVRDPDNVHSTTHQVGMPSSDAQVTIRWSPLPEVRGYSVEWNNDATARPDTASDLPGSATSARSQALTPGSWWFHLRTQGPGGDWTSTVVVGPFVIVAREPASDSRPPTTMTSASAPTVVVTTRAPITAEPAATSPPPPPLTTGLPEPTVTTPATTPPPTTGQPPVTHEPTSTAGQSTVVQTTSASEVTTTRPVEPAPTGRP